MMKSFFMLKIQICIGYMHIVLSPLLIITASIFAGVVIYKGETLLGIAAFFAGPVIESSLYHLHRMISFQRKLLKKRERLGEHSSDDA